mgnify:CR=1 FL=1|tara:strand:- start:3520 stop:4098 length:579 start_codon:yes stop_codon:yes gene_type:complete
MHNIRSEAEKFLGEPNNFRDTGHVMSCLDDRGLTKQQDWREGITIWKFADQSAIKVEGSDVSVLEPQETAQQWQKNKATYYRNVFFGEIIINAIESHCAGYLVWCSIQRYKWQDREEDVIATIVDDEGKEHHINNDVIRKGIGLILIGDVDVSRDIVDTLLEACQTMDAGDVDAEIADCIIQAGVLGEIVYC